MLCVCRNSVLLGIMALSSLVFLVLGAVFVAPYWLFDGTSFLGSTILGYLAVRSADQSVDGPAETNSGMSRNYATATCFLAGASILVEVGFMIAAGVLWNQVMNPYHRTSYGRDGNSFFFCSLYSSICNLFVVRHFRAIRNRTTSDSSLQDLGHQDYRNA